MIKANNIFRTVILDIIPTYNVLLLYADLKMQTYLITDLSLGKITIIISLSKITFPDIYN